MNKPLVSVIIVSYNHENYIKQSIISVMNQSYGNIELIVVDNGSTDNSINVIEKLRIIYNFKYIFNERNGVALAFEMGTKVAKGNYIIPFSSDDVMTHTRIEIQVDFLEKNRNIAACFGNMMCINSDFTIHKQLLRKHVLYKEYKFEDVFLKSVSLYSPTHMYRMEIFKEVNGYDKDYKIEDLALYFDILIKGYIFVSLNYLFAYYRIHNTSTHNNYKYMYIEKLHLYSKYKNHPLYIEGLNLVNLEHFSVFGSYHKIDAIKLLPKVYTKVTSKYLYIGLFRLLFDWRYFAK